MNLLRLLSLIILLLLGVTGCERPKPAAAASPPPKVTVAHPIVRDVTQWDEYTGRLESVEKVDVKSQVSGFVESVSFTEGSEVKKGDVLLTIDSRISRAQLENAQAAVQEAKARLELAQAQLELSRNDLKRGQQAARGNGISQEELDTRRLTVSQNEASVAQARAAISVADSTVKATELNVEWCKVTAPITGRISSKGITPGNMLTGGPGQTTTITTIVSVDPIYCYVDADEAAVLRYQKLAREEKRVSAADAAIPCYMELANETNFPHVGSIDFLDNRIDPATGTRRARGVFPNRDGALLPGFFARFRVTGQSYPKAVLVIDDAIGVDQDRHFLNVLNADHSVERRAITAGPLIGELRIVLANLKPEDLVLVNGMINLAFLPPGGKVDPSTVPMPEKRFPASPTTTSKPATTQSATTSPEAGK